MAQSIQPRALVIELTTENNKEIFPHDFHQLSRTSTMGRKMLQPKNTYSDTEWRTVGDCLEYWSSLTNWMTSGSAGLCFSRRFRGMSHL